MRTVPAYLLACLLAPLPASAAGPRSTSDRSTEILRYDCGNTLGHRELTLFANGTVRIRDGERGKELMGLQELNPDELRGMVNRLREEDLSEDRTEKGVQGDWIERCELHLEIPGQPLQVFRFGRYDAMPLHLSRVLRVADDLAAKVGDLRGKEALPPGYQPTPGDVLKRVDGQLFRVRAFTGDKKGVELQGVDAPLTLFVLIDQMRQEFVALVPSRHR